MKVKQTNKVINRLNIKPLPLRANTIDYLINITLFWAENNPTGQFIWE
jgi:hypothetical protein